jgi:hypothetical protein
MTRTFLMSQGEDIIKESRQGDSPELTPAAIHFIFIVYGRSPNRTVR